MATLDAPAPVNLVRSIFLCNIFNFFFSASKACLIPFLTVYMKYLGLTAIQTGLIMGAKTLVGLVFAPLWSRCAVRCGRRRCMLMFSLFMMLVTYLSLAAVPSINNGMFKSRCDAQIGSEQIINMPNLHGGLNNVDNSKTTKMPSSPTVVNITNLLQKSSTKLPSVPSHIVNNSNEHVEQSSIKPVPTSDTVTERLPTVNKDNTPTPVPPVLKTTAAVTKPEDDISDVLKQLLIEVGIPEVRLEGLSDLDMMQLVNELLKNKEGKEMLSDALAAMPEGGVTDELNSLLEGSNKRKKRETNDKESSTGSPNDIETKTESEASSWESWKHTVFSKLKELKDHMRDTENQVFIVVLIVLMVGEMVSCPVEKIADDGWFEFLESIDDLEKYGLQRIWSSVAFIIFPLIVTLAVDNTRCLFGMSVHPFMLHFYLFGGFLGLTFFIAFFYPICTSEKYRYATKVMKGIRVVCCNARSLVFVITLMVMGVVYASYYNFLFWLLIDLGSKEITLGLCLTMAALAEIPMLLFNGKLIQKIGNGGVVTLSLLFLSARCLYYSFLTTPWAVIPAEITHAFTHTAMWWAVLSSPSYNASPALSRSIRSILSSLYFGVGFAVGSFVSGVVYDTYGATILFQAGAVLSIGWFPFLCIGVGCCKEKDKNEVKYTRLLASDDASDDSDSVSDDWLEQALKEK